MLIEGSLIATCQHVWREATRAAAGSPFFVVEIEYPRARVGGMPFRGTARLADSCEDIEIADPVPDLVLLEPDQIPSGVMTLQLAAQERLEVGRGYVHARLARTDPQGSVIWVDAFPKGQIDLRQTDDGLRQFTGEAPTGFWFTSGSSGSPVFLDDGQQLAGILSLSELGANEGRSQIHEAFLVPATTIRRFVSRRVARSAAEYKGIDPANVLSILNAIGLGEVPIAEIPAGVKEFVDANRPLALPFPASLRTRKELQQQIDALAPSQAEALAHEMQPALVGANALVQGLVRALDPRDTRFTDPVMAKLVLEAWVLMHENVTGLQTWADAIGRINPK